MSYDILGNLVKVLPPNAFAPGADPDDWEITYGYDARSQLIAKTTPDTDDTFAYQYDAKGNLRFVNDPNVQFDGKSAINPDEAYYRGDSLGGTFGTMYIALSTDVPRGLVGEPAMPYNFILNRSIDFNQFFKLLV